MYGEFAGAPIFEVAFGIPQESGGGNDFFPHRCREFLHVAGTFFHDGIRQFRHLDFDERGNLHTVEIGIRIEHDFRYRSAVETEQIGDAVFDVTGGFGESQGLKEPQRAFEGVGTESDLFARFDSPAGEDGGFGFDLRIVPFLADAEFLAVSFHPNGDELLLGNEFRPKFEKPGFVTVFVDFDDLGFHLGKRERAFFHITDVTDNAADSTYASKFFTFSSQVCNKWFSEISRMLYYKGNS